MDLLHSWGVELAVHLQTKHNRYEHVFSAASTVADLHTTFFFFFPVWFHLRRDTGLRLIWVAVLGDWLNLVLKWYERGEKQTHKERKRLHFECLGFCTAGFCLGRGRTGGFTRPGFTDQDRLPLCSSFPSHARLDQVQFMTDRSQMAAD